jgi:hypothetical protein
MRRGLVALLVVAACNGGQGVDIEVHQGSESIDAVELWLAYDVCKLQGTTDECDGIGWPSAQLRPSGDVYTLGEDEKLVRTDVVVDGVAQLHLESTPKTSAPYIIAVVGYHGGSSAGVKMLSGAEIPTDDQAHWRIELDDVGQVTENITADPGEKPTRNALVWAREPLSTMRDVSGLTGCFAYQKWNDTDKQWETKYIVPPSDPDCDGDPPDCNPYWYKASVSNARCVKNVTSPAGVCAVGRADCGAEMGDIACSAQTDPMICVGSNLCTRCADSPDLGACIKSEVSNIGVIPAGMPMQQCPMFATDNGPCINTTSGMQGWRSNFFVGGGACAPNAANQNAVLRPLILPFSGGMATMQLNNGASVFVHASPGPLGGCEVDITYTSMQATTQKVPVIVAISYGPTREILIPVILDFDASQSVCPSPSTQSLCTQLGNWPENMLPGDSIFECTR